ncbi:MAG: adenylate cyclase [Acidobacteria bacterium]|nr:MAG: adenylate cyclase [Acidobacteriota bacterium]
MRILNYEFKARLKSERRVRAELRKLRARFAGLDRQVDTYFRVPRGRLKVREGKIENALIFYRRTNERRARSSQVLLVKLAPGNSMRKILGAVFGVLAVVEKRREIYFWKNVKIHLDRVHGLGRFVEVEAMKKSKVESQKLKARALRRQALEFQRRFGIADSEIVPESYSDLILRKTPP